MNEPVSHDAAVDLAERVYVVLTYLMKLEAWPGYFRGAWWCGAVQHERGKIERILAEAPGLRGTVAEIIAGTIDRARAHVAAGMASAKETPARPIYGIVYTADQVVRDWYPKGAPVGPAADGWPGGFAE